MKSNENKELIMAIEELEKERGIDKNYLLESLEVALTSAYKKNFDSADNVKIEMDPETGEIHIYAQKEVVEKVENDKLQISLDELSTLIDINVENLKEMYPELEKNKNDIKNVILEEKDKFVKTLIYKADDKFYAVLIKGSNEVNEAKLKKLLKVSEISLAEPTDVEDLTNAKVGFAGPIGLNIPIIIDNEVANMKNFIVGANKTDYHYKNVNLEDFDYLMIGDIRCITDLDVCPKCGQKLNIKNGIEIGNTFKLGTKYSEALGLTYLNKENQSKYVWMGCYGIGIGRCMASVVEQNHDDKGIIWPVEIAPFKVAIIIVNTKDEAQNDAANYLYTEFRKNKISTILDDRDERVGVKFNDMDLIGIPIRITIGNKINDQLVEVKERKKESFEEISLYDALARIEDILDGE